MRLDHQLPIEESLRLGARGLGGGGGRQLDLAVRELPLHARQLHLALPLHLDVRVVARVHDSREWWCRHKLRGEVARHRERRGPQQPDGKAAEDESVEGHRRGQHHAAEANDVLPTGILAHAADLLLLGSRSSSGLLGSFFFALSDPLVVRATDIADDRAARRLGLTRRSGSDRAAWRDGNSRFDPALTFVPIIQLLLPTHGLARRSEGSIAPWRRRSLCRGNTLALHRGPVMESAAAATASSARAMESAAAATASSAGRRRGAAAGGS